MGKIRSMLVVGGAGQVYPGDDTLTNANTSNAAGTTQSNVKVNQAVKIHRVVYLSGTTGTLILGDKDGNDYIAANPLVHGFNGPAGASNPFDINMGGVEFENGLSAISTNCNWFVIYEAIGG